ncbi:MAG: AbrB family transcriptional regulator [Dongiaceae bacterium]
MESVRPVWQWAILLVGSLVLTLVIEIWALPAAFLLGPMVVGVVIALKGATIRTPNMLLFFAQAIIGCLIARSITLDILATVLQNWLPILIVVMTTILASAFVGWLMVRFSTLPGTTGAWGSSPGAASTMVVMAEAFGADPRLVAFMQYSRVLLVALTTSLISRFVFDVVGQSAPSVHWFGGTQWLPFAQTFAVAAIGATIGVRLRIPAGAMLVPVMAGSMLQSTGLATMELPPWLLAVSYAILGWYVGLRFTRDIVFHVLRALPQTLLSMLALLGLCGGSAFLLTRLLHIDPLTAYLATSPGGLDTVAIIAAASTADIAFVLALQTVRFLLVILIGPPMANLTARLAGVRHPKSEEKNGNKL